MLDINLLEYLITFQEAGSLSKASELLHLSQPSLTKAMQKLEAELGITIFERSANKIVLNQNGLDILTYAKDILSMVNKLEQRAKDLKNNVLTITIGYTAPGPVFRYPNLFCLTHTNLKVTSTIDNENNLIQGLLNNTYDIIFINKPYNIENVYCQKTMTENLSISVPNSHFLAYYKNGIHFSEADGQSFILLAEIGYWENILAKHFHNSRFIKQNSCQYLYELIENSSIPCFITNITEKYHNVKNRVTIPFLDDDAKLDFYVLCKNKNKELLKVLN